MIPQVTVGPEILVGVKGTLLTARVLAAEVPQVLEAVTEIFPEVNRLLLMVVVMVLVRELPEKPVGNVQLY